MPPPTVLTAPSSARDPPNPPVQSIILPGTAHLPAHLCIAEDCPHAATPPSRSPFAHGWQGPPRGLAVTVRWPRPCSPGLGWQPRTRKDGGAPHGLRGLFFSLALRSVSQGSPPIPISQPHADPQSCQHPALHVSAHRGFSYCFAPQTRLLGALSGHPSLGRSGWPGLSPASGPHLTPASRFLPARPPAPRGLCSLFLRAALPPAAGSRRHCLEPPVRRRGQGGLRRQGPSAAPEP